MRSIRLPLTLVLLATLSFASEPATAQTAPSDDEAFVVEIVEPIDLAAYPTVGVFVRALDQTQQPVANLTAAALDFEEDGRPLSAFELQPTALGLQVVFVVDAGAQPGRAGETGQATLEEARAAIRLFATEYMRPGDSTAIWAMDSGAAVAVQTPTGVAADVVAALDVFTLQPTDTITPAITAALDSFAASGAGASRQRLLVVLSPGWSESPDPTLTERIDSSGVQVYGVLTRRGLDLKSGLNTLVTRLARPGLFLHYTGPQAVRSLYGAWAAGREGYRLTYVSPSAAPGRHQIGLRLRGSAEGAASAAYLAPVPAGPRIVFTSHQAGFQAGRLASELIGVAVTTAPGEPVIDRAELFVNDASQGVLEGPGPYAWAWDPAPYGDLLATEGESAGAVELRVQVTDATGQTTTTTLRGQAIYASIDACTAYRGFPAVGRSLYAACRSTGLTPPVVFVLLLLLVVFGVLLWLWRNRGAVTSAGQQMGRRLTDVYRRLTRASGRRTPLAYLDVIEGLEPGARNSFDLFGQTPVGRSHDYAELCFHAERQRSPISGLHCTVHEDEGGQGWSIEDEDSTNGTYVNGVRLPGLGQRLALHDGDVIELAQVERGGLKFRFRLAAAARAEPGAASSASAGRVTRSSAGRETRPLVAARGPAAEPELEFDPRRHDF